jgi:hypothetical protein
MTPKEILTKEFLIEHYINQNKSAQVIAKENGIKSHNSVSQFISKFGLHRENRRQAGNKLTKEYLIEEYVNKRKSIKTIALEAGTSHKATVKDKLVEYGIPIRRIRTFADGTFSEKQLKNWNEKSCPYYEIPRNYWYQMLNSAKLRNLTFELTIEYLYDLFLKQNRKCKISGIDIKFRKLGEPKDFTTASLDRIDSSKPYIENNVQWLHKRVNVMKSNLSDEEFINICKTIAKHQNDNNLSQVI